MWLKPFSFDQIEVVVDKVASFDKMRRVTKYYVEESDTRSSDIVGESEPIEKLKNLVSKVAKTEATVLITGENGTGKELVARELYRNSMLAKQPYIRVNCAAISETLMESEFFGHEKGAFTGQPKEGKGGLNWPMEELFCWTKLARLHRLCRQNSYVFTGKRI